MVREQKSLRDTGHVSSETKEVLNQLKIDTVIVPGGCTKYVQAPDVSWNKPFKAVVAEKYAEWMATEENKPVTKATATCQGGNLKPPGYDLVCQWVLEAWDSLSTELIKKSFAVCGITHSNLSEISAIQADKPCHAALAVLEDENRMPIGDDDCVGLQVVHDKFTWPYIDHEKKVDKEDKEKKKKESPTMPKRGRGRPKGSKNKPKLNPPKPAESESDYEHSEAEVTEI